MDYLDFIAKLERIYQLEDIHSDDITVKEQQELNDLSKEIEAESFVIGDEYV